jgi:asparagine N-glycosylation enzyme membrane subunit Stt3
MLPEMRTDAGPRSAEGEVGDEAGAERRWRLGLTLVFVLALVARSLGFERIFLDDGQLAFAAGDAFYHARRALHSFQYFPDLLLFDPCINYPDGARVPHPPLLDWGTAGLARLLGDTRATFERTAAWTPALLGSLAILPIAALGRRLRSAGTGLGAAAIYALLPISINYGQVGNFDHHAPAGLIGACLLLLYSMALEPDRRGRALAAPAAWLVVARLGMLLSWHGSLLYLLPGEAALVLAGALRRRPDALAAQAIGSGATAMLALPLVILLNAGMPPRDLAFSASTFSLLHVLVFAACAIVCIAQRALDERLQPANVARSALGLGAISAAVAILTLALPGVWSGILPALSFLGANDGYTERVVEQLPLFFSGGELGISAAHAHMGLFAWLVPVVPFAYALQIGRDESSRAADPRGLFLAAWSLLFGYLAYQQVRYAHDYAPAGVIGFALLLGAAAERVSERPGWPLGRAVTASAFGLLCLLPALVLHHAPVARLSWQSIRGDLADVDTALLSIGGTQVRFAQALASVTPETGACSGPEGGTPEYGVLAHVGLGHVLHYTASRATPADPFGPYIGREHFESVARFMSSEDEAEALSIAEALRTHWIATAAEVIPQAPRSMAERLHDADGSARDGLPHLAHFRLVWEGPAGGTPMAVIFGATPDAAAPYKLFEIVPGASIEVPAAPGTPVAVEVPLETPIGRRLRHRAEAVADADGLARVRVPHASGRSSSTEVAGDRVRALGPHVVKAGERRWRVRVPESAVRRGGVVRLSDRPASPASATPDGNPR